MRLELADARSRRCQHQPTPGGRPCALRWPRGHTHTRWAWRPSVSRHRPCSLSRPEAQERRCLPATPTERRRIAQEATPRHERLPNVPLASLDAGRLVIARGGFLRSRFVSGGLRSASLTCTPTSCVRVGADPALGPRLHEVGPRSASATRLGAGAPSRQSQRLLGLPAVLRQRLLISRTQSSRPLGRQSQCSRARLQRQQATA